MNYTLYVDESGDFESQRGQWIISGMLFTDSYENCEKAFSLKLASLPSELNLKSIRDFHLTEFRRNYDNDIALDMAKKTFKKLDNLPFSYHCLVTINNSKISLSNREKTYRSMLSDLLALCETVLKDNDKITNLDLVVATRTIEGQLQTNIGNIKEDIINSLPIALEVDLATKGIVDLIGKHIKIYMDYANNSWGLVFADFLANLNYHNRKTNEKQYLQELANMGKYSLFESFGDYETRRASIAERDEDFILALYRWLCILAQNETNEKAIETIQRLFFKIFNKRGTTGSKISFEAVIERLWRNNSSSDKYIVLSKILKAFEYQLENFFESNNIQDFEQYLFRLRNLMLIIENHLGNTQDGFTLAKKQHSFLKYLASNPEHFNMILDFKSIEIEIHINALDLAAALRLAIDYSKTIDNFKEVWQLLVDEDTERFEFSRGFIKSKMILYRAIILNIGLESVDIEETLLNDFIQLENNLSNKSDKSRFENYKIMMLLKQKLPKKALHFYLEKFKDDTVQFSIFDIFWFLKTINDCLLEKITININVIKNALHHQLEYQNLEQIGHPMDLVLRELSLFEFLTNDKSKALKYIKKSKNAFNLENSNIALWLEITMEIYEDYYKDKIKSENEYFSKLNQNDFLRCIISKEEISLIEKIRYFSPY